MNNSPQTIKKSNFPSILQSAGDARYGRNKKASAPETRIYPHAASIAEIRKLTSDLELWARRGEVNHMQVCVKSIARELAHIESCLEFVGALPVTQEAAQ